MNRHLNSHLHEKIIKLQNYWSVLANRKVNKATDYIYYVLDKALCYKTIKGLSEDQVVEYVFNKLMTAFTPSKKTKHQSFLSNLLQVATFENSDDVGLLAFKVLSYYDYKHGPNNSMQELAA